MAAASQEVAVSKVRFRVGDFDIGSGTGFSVESFEVSVALINGVALASTSFFQGRPVCFSHRLPVDPTHRVTKVHIQL